MKKKISPVTGIIALVIVVAVMVVAGYKMFLSPMPNEPVNASPYTRELNERMKKAFANQNAPGGAPAVPLQPAPGQ